MKDIIKKNNKQYEIIPIFSEKGKDIQSVIINAFLKYLKYNDYK